MRWSETFIPTTREVPAEAESPSHRLLLRAGCIRKLSAGLYTYLPLGLKVIRNVENIIREEMERQSARELLMPILQPRELWESSSRWGAKELSMLTLKNRTGQEFVLGPTHEEVITDLARKEIRSYKDLPKNFYQIQTKFRDELRARFGLIRAKEFIMKDGYSFDADEESALASYAKMEQAYLRIFSRCGLEVQKVEADPGAMGGGRTHEFMALADVGEDIIVQCAGCSYSANMETACAGSAPKEESGEAPDEKQVVSTPGVKTVGELAEFFSVKPAKMIKTLFYRIDGALAAVLVRGDKDINEIKLRRHAGASEIAMAEEEAILGLTGAPVGFSGPVGLKKTRILADKSVTGIVNAITGANEEDRHFINVNIRRDFEPDEVMDISYPEAGDPCPECGAVLEKRRGIEVGQIFSLGTKYSRSLGATFLDSSGREKFCVMGCYGIGVSRTVAAIVEQHHDDEGIIWPEEISPFKVLLLPIAGDKSGEIAEKLYSSLESRGVSVLMDDRDERAGVKFKDADLIGIPLRITVGPKNAEKGLVEIYSRSKKETVEAPVEEVAGGGLPSF